MRGERGGETYGLVHETIHTCSMGFEQGTYIPSRFDHG